MSLRIYEVQLVLNDLAITIFAPPPPGSIFFVISEEPAASGILSLWFRPLNEPRVPLQRSIASSPKLEDRRLEFRVKPSAAFASHIDGELPNHATITVLENEPVGARLSDILEDIKKVRGRAQEMDLVWLEAVWSTASTFREAQIAGASAVRFTVDGKVVTRWRFLLSDTLIKVVPAHDFHGKHTFKLVACVREAGIVTRYSKTFDVIATKKSPYLQASGSIEYKPRSQPAVPDKNDSTIGRSLEARRLGAVATTNIGAIALELDSLIIDLEEDTPLRLLFPSIFPDEKSLAGSVCKTTFRLFSLENALDSVISLSLGTKDVNNIHDPTVDHPCTEMLLVRLKATIKHIWAQVIIEVTNAEGDTQALASFPLKWTVIPSVNLPVPNRLLMGAHNTLGGGVIELKLNYSDISVYTQVNISIENCSYFNVQLVGDGSLTSEECVFLLASANENSTENDNSGIAISQRHEAIFGLGVEATVSMFEQDDSGAIWIQSLSNIVSYSLFFCELASTNNGPQILENGRTKQFLFSEFAFALLGADVPAAQRLASVSFVGDTDLLASIGSFQVGDTFSELKPYNSTALYVTLSADSASYFTFTPSRIESFIIDVMLEWRDTTQSDLGCSFVQNLAVFVLPSFSQPLFITPFLFSQKNLQGSSAHITVPIMQTTLPEIEYLTLTLAINGTAADQVTVERGGTQYYPSPNDQRFYFLLKRENNLDIARQVTISVTPKSSFTGFLTCALSVSAIGIVNSAISFEELIAESSTVRDIEVEWIPAVEELDEPGTSGEAVYRSLPTHIFGTSTLSFQYQMTSDFSSISTDVILNSSNIRPVWSSDSIVINQGEWNYAQTLIDITYPTTVEVVFRAIASIHDTLRLKAIAIRDLMRENMLGTIEFDRATGGMIYIKVDTAQSIPEPVLFRAYVKQSGSSEQPTLVLQFLGCGDITTMYPCVDSSDTSITSPHQCKNLCFAVETQLQFTPYSVVRSAQMISLPINGAWTIEFWVYLRDLSVGSDQLLLLFGTMDGSLSITLNSYITISWCSNALKIHRGIPVRRWTHVAVVFSGEYEVAVLLDGQTAASGQINKDNCDMPLFAYLQLGRAENTNWFPSGVDGSTNSVDFIVQEVNVSSTRPIQSLGIDGDGSCFYKLSTSVDGNLPASTCNKMCGDGSLKTCGSASSKQVVSLYTRGSIGVGGLSPLTDYDISVELVSEDGVDFKITQPLMATTSKSTAPGKVEYISVVESLGNSIEIQWSPVEDNGGSEVTSYKIFLNGILVTETDDGNTLSESLHVRETQNSYDITIQAQNAHGLGPLSSSLVVIGGYNGPVPEAPLPPNVTFSSGGTVELALDYTTIWAVETLSSIVVIEQRQTSPSFFTKSFYRLNDSLATIYKLQHNTVYIFRVSVISKYGAQSGFSTPLFVKTGDRGSPSKTPLPLVTSVTGKLCDLMVDPVQPACSCAFVATSLTSESTLVRLTRDAEFTPLLPNTSYTLKVLALQVGVVCDTLTEGGLESDAFTVKTDVAAIPPPPPRPALQRVSGCTAMVTVTPPEDFAGANIIGMSVRVFASDGTLYTSFVVTSYPGVVTVQNLLAQTNYSVKSSLNTTLGESGFSDALLFTTEGPSRPGPTQLKINDFDASTAVLQWEEPQDSGGGATSGYLMYQRAIKENATWILIYNGSRDASATSYTAVGLLAQTTYIFSLTPINQYGVSGLKDDNVVSVTTADPTIPSPPTDLLQKQVDGGYVDLSFTKPSNTGGFSLNSFRYVAQLKYLRSCIDDETECSSCSHTISSEKLISTVDGNSSPCSIGACKDFQGCCKDNEIVCGILVTEIKQCSSLAEVGTCRVEGLQYSTYYMIALAAVNEEGISVFSNSISIVTSDARRPGVPQLGVESATGGLIAMKWTLPQDTGGASIVRMSLSVDGGELFDTHSALVYTHCGLTKSTEYTYSIEIENAAGYMNRATHTFETTIATPPGLVAIFEPTVGMQTVQIPVELSCDGGGEDDTPTLSYRVFEVGVTNPWMEGTAPCCFLDIGGLGASTSYEVYVRAYSASLAGEWTTTTFTTLSGIPSNPNTTFLYATSTALQLALVSPSFPGGGDLSIEAKVTSVATDSLVFEDALTCASTDFTYNCPDTLSISGLIATQDDYTYNVAVRSVGTGGASTWVTQSFEADSGVTGTIKFVKTFYDEFEGIAVDVGVARVYGTTSQDQAHFIINSGTTGSSWSCLPTPVGTTCSPDALGNNSGKGPTMVTIAAVDTMLYEDTPVSMYLTLLSATNSEIDDAQCVVHFKDNGDAGLLQFSSAEINVIENIGNTDITILRTGGVSGQVTVVLKSTISSSIRANEIEEIVVFEDGVGNATLSIDIRSSSEYEQRRFVLMLVNATGGAKVGSGNLTVSIDDQGDVSLPGRPHVSQGLTTGGCIEVLLGQPHFMGGKDVTAFEFVGVVSILNDDFKASFRTMKNIVTTCGLKSETEYRVTVSIINTRGEGESQTKSILTGVLSAPSEIVELLAATTSGHSKLSWQAPFDEGGMPIKTYEITVLNKVTSEVQTFKTLGHVVTVSISFLTAATEYEFAVHAVNSGGLVGPESTTTVTTGDAVPPLPPPPVELRYATGGALYITIVAPEDCGGSYLTSYSLNIARHTGGNVVDRQYVSGILQNPSSYLERRVANVTIYRLLSKSEYIITVSVENAKGWSGNSVKTNFLTIAPSTISDINSPKVLSEDPGELTLGWDTPLDSGGLNIVGYVVQSRHQYTNGSWTLSEIVLDARTSLARTALINGILANTAYAFSVVAYNFRSLCLPGEYITPSDELHFTTQDASVPSQPKNLRAVAVTGGSITLAWDPPRSTGGEVLLHYIIIGSEQSSVLQPLVNVSAAGATLHTLYHFLAFTTYEFAIAGENSRGTGVYSSPLIVTTKAVSAPGPPKNVHQIKVASGGTIKLGWDSPDDSGGAQVQQYLVLRDDILIGAVVATGYTMIYEDQTNILADTVYTYSVFASNDVVTSTEGTHIIAHSSVASAPAPPAATAEAGSGLIDLRLIPSTDSGGMPIRYFTLTVVRGSAIVETFKVSNSVTTVTGLYADTQYSIFIQTGNDVGDSDQIVLVVTTTSATVPDTMDAPRLLNVTGGCLRFEVVPPPNFGGSMITDYLFYVNGTLSETVRMSSTAYDLVGLVALTCYSITVSAVNAIGESDLSSALVVWTSRVTIPGIVWNLKMVLKGYDIIEVEWMAPQDTGGDLADVQYEIQFSSDIGNASLISRATNSASLSGLEPAMPYTIQVRAKNGEGEGLWSHVLDVVTDPVSPGVIGFDRSDITVSEGSASAMLTLVRSMGGSMPAKCMYHTENGTAIAGVHYIQSSGKVMFDRDSNSEQIFVNILDNDVTDDPDRYFFISIQAYDNTSGGIGEYASVKVIITDNGDAGIVTFEHTIYSVSESVSTINITIMRMLAFSGNGTFAVDTEDIPGSAARGVDYVLQTSEVSFSDQQKEAVVTIEITNDESYQDNKIFYLGLRVVSGRIGIKGNPTTLVKILDDGDISPPGLVTDVQVIPISGGVVRVSWIAPQYTGARNVDKLVYNILVIEVQSGLRQEQSVDTPTLVISQLASRTAYQISVVTKNAYLAGVYTTPVPFLMGSATPPTKPEDVRLISRTGGMVTLSWTAPFDLGGAGIKSYLVNVSRHSHSVFVGAYTTNENTVFANGLLPETSYSATVEAITKDGVAGEASIPIIFTTTGVSVPGKPSSLSITKRTGGALYVEMTPPLDVGGAPILNYSLFTTSAHYPNVFHQVYEGPSPSFIVARLTYSTTYKLQYKLSDVYTETTSFLSLPDEVQNLVVLSRTGGSVTLFWTTPLDLGGADITSYDVSFFLGYEVKGQYKQRVSGISANATSAAVKVVGLLANSMYGFSVSGVNDVSVCEDPAAVLNRKILHSSTDPLVSLPDTPRDLVVTSSTSGMQIIQWSASDDAGGDSFVGYILYSDSGDILYNGTSTTFIRGHLTKSTVYGYSVSAWNTAGTSLRSPRVFGSTKADVVAPSQPLNLSQSSSTGGSIGLTWEMPLDNGGGVILSYNLYRNSVWRADIPAGEATMLYLDEFMLASSQDYVYVVHATNSIGVGAMSEKLVATTGSASTPKPPIRLELVAKGGYISASWNHAADSGGIPLVAFRLEVALDSHTVLTKSFGNMTLSYTFYGTNAGMSYSVQVISINEIGESPPITRIVENGVAVRPGITLTPELIVEQVALSPWSKVLRLYLPIDDGGAKISELILYQNGTRIKSVSVVDAVFQAALGDPTTRSTQVQVGPLHAGAIYYFSVSAISTIGEGAVSNALKVVTTPATLPSEPNNLVVDRRTAFSVILKWDRSTDTGGDEVVYEVQYNNTNTSEAFVMEATTTTVEIPKLIPGNIYLIRLRARNSAGVSAWTASVIAETDVTQRGAITFSLESPTVFENITSVTVQLLRVNGSSKTISCSYSVGPGTAAYGTDYLLPPETERTFTFVGQLIVQRFVIQVINNDKYEPDPRIINLTLADTTYERSDPFPPTPIIISILDDGDAGTIGFADSDIVVLESARILSLQLQRLYGKSTATSVRVVPFIGLPSTTQPDVGFRLPAVSINFIDGQTDASASIVIKDNDAYDFPFLYFFLTLEISAGAAKVGANSMIRVEVQDDGDHSVPAQMMTPVLYKATGGMLALQWEPPINTGGRDLSIIGYNISIRVSDTTKWIITHNNDTMLPFGGLHVLTNYSFTVAALNLIGYGLSSSNVTFSTTNFTSPGKIDQITLLYRTGGLLMVNVSTPIDTGGAPITGFLLYLLDQDGIYQVCHLEPCEILVLTNLSPDDSFAFTDDIQRDRSDFISDTG
ncbi:unnamed protein product [Phytophthora lilii]|uniref:Unnamed protein product n=1 Tax=Phytophthora lilii TaxID=2077276 RepID=A0A9W6TCU6_9STRA|nr:unnamed protein product [Phytophthora lilii]